METVAVRPSYEQAQSFDPLASVKMMRHDLANVGYVSHETRERVYDEELSYLAEGIDRASRTSFGLRREAEQIVYFTKGEWRPYVGMLLTGLEVTKQEASVDSRRTFLHDRAVEDYYKGQQMNALLPGKRMSWYSEYPYEEEAAYGTEFVTGCGFQSQRKMGFIYQAYCEADGTVVLESQTVDRSHSAAFESAMLLAKNQPDASLDILVGAYDSTLGGLQGERLYAGRRVSEKEGNIWNEIRAQRDLIEYFMNELEAIAKSNAPLDALEMRAKKHVYGVWATFKKRLEASTSGYESSVMYAKGIDIEVSNNFSQFADQGMELVGCGGKISFMRNQNDIMNVASNEVFNTIFGASKESNESLPALIKCINCKEKVPSKKVVKVKSWCCPSCKYEVDICNGKVLCAGVKKRK